MIEKYLNKGFVELCLLDNGITIPASFTRSRMIYDNQQDSVAIVDAINGLSSKESIERGYGLKSIVKILLKGLDSQIFFISGLGAVFLSKGKQIRYDLTHKLRFNGTLISLEVPYPSPTIDIYDYLD